MIEVETFLDIAAPPMKVWRALSDFRCYPRWNPYREIVGVAGLGEKVVMRIGPVAGRRRSQTARITAFEPGSILTFATGHPLLGAATETFELARSARGTRLRHVAQMKGLGSRLIGERTLGPRLSKIYDRVNDALAQYVTTVAQPKRRASP